MPPLPFKPRPPKTRTFVGRNVTVTIPETWNPEAENAKLAVLVALDVALTKDDRDRRYVIAPAPRLGYFKTEVWMGRNLHRSRTVVGHHDTKGARRQFDREIADLVADGWIQVP